MTKAKKNVSRWIVGLNGRPRRVRITEHEAGMRHILIPFRSDGCRCWFAYLHLTEREAWREAYRRACANWSAVRAEKRKAERDEKWIERDIVACERALRSLPRGSDGLVTAAKGERV